jgi:BlaI family penicillinase repressor
MRSVHVPDAELHVLATLRRRGEATAREIREDMLGERPLAHGSVLTLLGRLERRGLVTKYKGSHGKAYVYVPTARVEASAKPMVKRLADRLFGGNPVQLVASLFESRPPTPAQLAELQQLLAEMTSNRKRK